MFALFNLWRFVDDFYLHPPRVEIVNTMLQCGAAASPMLIVKNEPLAADSSGSGPGLTRSQDQEPPSCPSVLRKLRGDLPIRIRRQERRIQTLALIATSVITLLSTLKLMTLIRRLCSPVRLVENKKLPMRIFLNMSRTLMLVMTWSLCSLASSYPL